MRSFPVRGFLVFALLVGAHLGRLTAQELPATPWQLDLSGPLWRFEGIAPGRGEQESFHLASGNTGGWESAMVPGDVYTDLWRAGEIDDPHFGRNGAKAAWVMEREWWYARNFKVPAAEQGKRIRLIFEGVDYACDVWLNGRHLGHHEGMFSPLEFEISDLLVYGDGRAANNLAVRLAPPPRDYRSVVGRKFHWEGDYWRDLVPMGIWKPVRLVATGDWRMQDVHPATRIDPDGSAAVTMHLTLAGASVRPGALRAAITLKGANFDGPIYTAEVAIPAPAPGGSAQAVIQVPQAQLWWPWDLGRPNLYQAEVTLHDTAGQVLDRTVKRFGIREIRMERNPGYTPEEVRYPWTMLVNGKPTFLRSATWGGPPDIFYGRSGPEQYRKLVSLARESNSNNLRIFGWHPTEIDLFYDLCDEQGITVWQDLLPIASSMIPPDGATHRAINAEAVAVIKNLRHHPSVVLLEGGEETFFSRYFLQDVKSTAQFLLDLENVIRPYTDLPYIPTSPLSYPSFLIEMGIGGKKETAHTHQQFYQFGEKIIEDEVKGWDYAALPEFGVTAAPNVESIKRFIPAAELWPPGPSWGYHWADLDVFRALNFQIFGNERTGSLEEFVMATQIAQGTIFQFGIEYMRRRKPKSTAVSICHLMTFSPDFKWGIVDAYQEKKQSFHFVQRAFQPLLVSLEHEKRRWLPGENFSGRIWVVNDYAEAYRNCTIETTITDAAGKQLWHDGVPVASIAPSSAAAIAPVPWKVTGRMGDVFRVTMTLQDAAGRALSHNFYDLICGDQDKARADCANRAKEMKARRDEFGYHNYFRYYPALSGKHGTTPSNDIPVPAQEFFAP